MLTDSAPERQVRTPLTVSITSAPGKGSAPGGTAPKKGTSPGRSHPKGSFNPAHKCLINRWEKDLLEILLTVTNNALTILPQISLSAITELSVVPQADRGFYFSTNVDFVIVDDSFRPLIAVELNSSYHDNRQQNAKDIVKAQILARAKIPLLRARWQGALRLLLEHQEEYVEMHILTLKGFAEASTLLYDLYEDSQTLS